METDPFRKLGDPASIGAITGIVTVIITALALPDTTRLYGISIVIIVAIIYPCYFILLRIISKPRNTIPLHENRLSNNLGASRRPNLYQQASTYSQNRVAIIDNIKLYSPVVIFLVSDITIGVITFLFPEQTLNVHLGLLLIIMIFLVVYIAINLQKFSVRATNKLSKILSILFFLSSITLLLIGIFDDNLFLNASKEAHIDSKTSLVLGLFCSSLFYFIGYSTVLILTLLNFAIKKLIMKLRN